MFLHKLHLFWSVIEWVIRIFPGASLFMPHGVYGACIFFFYSSIGYKNTKTFPVAFTFVICLSCQHWLVFLAYSPDVVCFDNSFSYLKSKNVFHFIEVVEPDTAVDMQLDVTDLWPRKTPATIGFRNNFVASWFFCIDYYCNIKYFNLFKYGRQSCLTFCRHSCLTFCRHNSEFIFCL